MKAWTKKALALLLILVMLVAMIPFGMISVSGLDYTKSEFSIASVDDWNDIAAYAAANPSARFTGKTIKLAKDVDFGGATIPTLFANNFEGTFDGQGYTLSNFNTEYGAVIANVTNAGSVIKNVKINGTVAYNTYHTDGTNGWQVFAGMLVNRMDAGTITDVSVAGSLTSNAYNVGAVAGLVALGDGVSVTIQNVNVSATVHNTRSKLSTAWHNAGGVVGGVESFTQTASLLIKNVNMSGSVTRDSGPAGGIIGAIFDRDSSNIPLYMGGTITVENCHVTGTVASATAGAGQGVGGIVGAFGAFKRESSDYYAFDGTLNISNCAVMGTLKNTNTTSTEPLAVGGIIGSASYGHATVNVDHCLVAATFPSQSLTATNGKGAGTILGAAASQTMFSLNVNNCVSTASGAMVGHSIAKEGQSAAWFSLNGKAQTSVSAGNSFGAWLYTNGITDSSVVTVSASAASSMIKKNDAGFVTRVGGQITALAVQDNVEDGATLSPSDTFAIRFIGISHVSNVASAKMTVVVRDAVTGEAYKKYEKACNLYDALNAYNVNGQNLKYYKAADFGANKFLALTIGGIPAGTVDYTFDFTPSYTTASGLVVTAETVSITYDKNGQYVYEKASFDALDLPSAPSVRVMSSNILVVDMKHTDYTGYLTDHEQRLKNMATIYNFYQPDFVGLQEVSDSPQVNDMDCFDGVKTMQSVLMSYMNTNYKYVDFSDKLGSNSHFTPIIYNSAKWTPTAHDYDTTNSCRNVNCTMHRWQWALFQSVEDVNETVIVMNLHGPTQAHGEAMGGKDIFFNEVNAKLKELSSLYPNATITITGDYNERADSTYLSMMIDGVKIQNTCNLTGNQEKSDIDHVFVSEELSSTQQFRVVDNFTVRRCSDHKAVFADILLEKVYVPTPGSAMDWEDGMMIYDINSNTNAIKVLGERHLESNKTLYADWTASGLEFYANMNSQSDIIFTANSTAPCYFKAYVDGTLWQNNGSDYYTVSGATKIVLQSVPAGTHTVRLVKATGYLLGQAEISAVELNGTISATPDNDLYIEFLGDSISCGWGVVGSHDGGYASQDGTLAYPYLVAQALGADYSILGLSGRGVVYGTDYNFDKNYLQASPARSTSAYGFERKADIVVINLGTNERGNHADTAEFEAGYVRLLENVFAKNGSDCIVYCLWGAMNDTYNTQIQSAIATYQASHAGAQIHTLTLARSTVDSGAPSWGHPSISDHAGYTTALTNALKNVIS